MARQVRVEILADASKYARGIKDAQKSTANFTDHTDRAGKALKAAFATFSAGVVVNQLSKYVAAARDSNRVTAQINAVIKSTRGAAGLSAKGFSDLATQISKTAAVDDDLIAGGEAILATFTNIKANTPERTFQRAEQAAVDMAAAMGHGEVTAEGLQTANIQLGKALNDPIKGMTALQKVGVTFSAQQKKQIQDFITTGQTAKAQGVILDEVAKEFGGSAASNATATKKLAVAWGNAQEVLGNLLIPTIDRGAELLTSFIGLVDRNRTAFGVLFGVLGGGAAIIGGLVVATKVHKAVTEGISTVTETWKAAQKGLNVVLGLTRGQAIATAAAEEVLAAKTVAAGTAAEGAAAKMGTAGLIGKVGGLSGALIALSPLLVTVGVGLEAIRERSDSATQAADRLQRNTDRLIDTAIKNGTVNQVIAESDRSAAKAKAEQGLQTAYAAKQTELQRQAMVNLVPQYQTSADKARLNAEAIKEMSGKLAEARNELAQNRESMAKTIESYDGLISKSKVTAGEVVKDLRNQVANFRTYSHDTQTLIRAGVNPAAIRELSEKGPEYVHALATGSRRRLSEYKQAWADRQAEVKGSFAASIDAQYRALAKKIRQMQAEINRLKGKDISISASLKLNFSKSFTQKDWVDVRLAAGRMATGGLVSGPGGPTSDMVPALLSNGEFVLNAGAVRELGVRQLEQLNTMRFASGGPVGTIDAEARAVNRLEAWGTGRRMNSGINKIMSTFGAIPGGAGGSGLARQVAVWTAMVLGRAGEWAAWYRRLMFESGGNPRAVNRTDSNWLAGHPSVGIAQVIRGTFQANAGRYRGVGPFAYGVSMNPYANSYAGAHYAIGRYGSLFAVDPQIRPIGYDRGGWLPPGLSMAYNGTGRPEPVGRGGDVHVHFNAPVYGDKRALAQVVRDAVRKAQGHEGIPPTQQLR